MRGAKKAAGMVSRTPQNMVLGESGLYKYMKRMICLHIFIHIKTDLLYDGESVTCRDPLCFATCRGSLQRIKAVSAPSHVNANCYVQFFA